MMKQEIEFIKFNPTQNMTILVRTKHPPEEHRHIAAALMAYDHVHAEQVGFIERPQRREADAFLRMAGGEFCGNACMALAAYLADERGLEPDNTAHFVLEVSGTDRNVACQVSRTNEAYVCRVAVPAPIAIERKIVQYEGDELRLAVIRYEHCIHIVIEVEQFSETMRNKAQGLAHLLGRIMGTDLIGILLFKPSTSELAPLIYVPSLDSMVWERGCGSGTASVGAYLAWSSQDSISAAIRQPGGTIRVTAEYDGGEAVTKLSIEGTAGIVALGKAFVDETRALTTI